MTDCFLLNGETADEQMKKKITQILILKIISLFDRIHELIDSVNESVRVERQKPNKRTKTNNQHRISLTNSVLNKDKQT